MVAIALTLDASVQSTLVGVDSGTRRCRLSDCAGAVRTCEDFSTKFAVKAPPIRAENWSVRSDNHQNPSTRSLRLALGSMVMATTLALSPAVATADPATGGNSAPTATTEAAAGAVAGTSSVVAFQNNGARPLPERQEEGVEKIRNGYQTLAMWMLPALLAIILGWLGFRHVNQKKGAIHTRGPDGRPAVAKTATQLRAEQIHQNDYTDFQNPLDDVFDAEANPEESAWIVGHNGETLDFDWDDDLGFHDRRVERREKHPKDPRPDKPPTPDPYDGLRDEDAELVAMQIGEPRPYLEGETMEPEGDEAATA